MSSLDEWRWLVSGIVGEEGSITNGKCEYSSKMYHIRHEFMDYGEDLDVGSRERKALEGDAADCNNTCAACSVRSRSTLTRLDQSEGLCLNLVEDGSCGLS